jgi:hypothetical protein
VLAVYKPLGVVPGREFDATKVAKINAATIRKAAEHIAAAKLAGMYNPAMRKKWNDLFLTKGQMTLDLLVTQSVVGPIGMPATEEVYPPIVTADGKPMNAKHDYVIRMSASTSILRRRNPTIFPKRIGCRSTVRTKAVAPSCGFTFRIWISSRLGHRPKRRNCNHD